MRSPSLVRSGSTAAVLGAVALATLAPSTDAAATTRALLPGTLPTFVDSAPLLGDASDAAPVDAIISLKQRDLAGLKARVAKVSDPESASYQHFLTPAQFRARYAPSKATVAAIEAFATGAGLHVVSVPSNHAYVRVVGTVAAAETAFGTRIATFSVKGAKVQAPKSAVSVPAALRSVVTDVVGLNTGDVAHPMATPPPAFVNPAPCSTSFGQNMATDKPQAYGKTQPYVPCGYTPKQLQGAYGVKDAIAAGIDGKGQRVAVIDAYSSPTAQQDLDTWSAKRGMASTAIDFHDTVQERSTPEGPAPSIPSDVPILGDTAVPPVVDPQGWAGEEQLDLEAVHAMAPGATLVYQGAVSPANEFFHMAQNDAVNGKIAQIVSNSYGGSTDTTDDTSDGYWMQAAATGIGIYFSSGDDGDQSEGTTSTATKSVDTAANSPYVTAVGGTTLGVGANDDYQFETYWGTFSATLANGSFGALPGTYNSGGGGGTSQVYAEPAYQKGVVPDAYAQIWKDDPNRMMDDPVNGTSAAVVPGRVVPDVSMLADPNSGFLMGITEDFTSYQNANVTAPGDTTMYGEYRIGGTSLSSPLFAGVMALADQAAGKAHGFANPALYQGKSGIAYHDVTAPAAPVAVVRNNYDNNVNGTVSSFLRTAGQLGTLHSVPGFDDSTGLGSPLGAGFLKTLAPAATIPASTATASPGSTPVATKPAATPVKPTTAGCALPANLVYLLHAEKGQRVIQVKLTVGKKTLVSRKGRRLTRVTIARPKGTRFTVTVLTHSNRGSTKRSTRTYTRSGCTKGKLSVVSHHKR